MRLRLDGKTALGAAVLAIAALVAVACSSSDGVTPSCTDAGSCFTPPGDAAFGGDDGGGATDDAAATDDDAPVD